MSSSAIRRVILLGAPGVGKGTYTRHISPVLGLEPIVVGDLVRREVREQTPTGRAIADAARRGDLVPDNVVLDLLLDHMRKRDLLDGGYILDGLPRNSMQAQAVDEILRPDLALHLTMDEGIMLSKMTARRLGPEDQVYNLAYIRKGDWDMPPLLPEPTRWDEACGALFCAHGTELKPNALVECPQCTAGLITREDDAPDVCRHRVEMYKRASKPLVDHYTHIRLDFEIDNGVKQCLPRLLGALDKFRRTAVPGRKGAPRVASRL